MTAFLEKKKAEFTDS